VFTKKRYETPMMAEVGAFATVTRGGCGYYYERRYLWY